MIQKRLHTFETNSSSCHSITFSNDGEMLISDTHIIADTDGEYCGSDNYVYDTEYECTYDEGETHDEPQFKMSYAMVCLVEYFNRRAYEEKIEYLKAHNAPEEKIEHAYTEPLPEEVYEKLTDDFEIAKTNIIESFAKYGVQVDWKVPEPKNLDEINASKYGKDLIDINGYIDHDSSCSQHEEAPWKLAEMWMNPEELVNFVYNKKNTVLIKYCG